MDILTLVVALWEWEFDWIPLLYTPNSFFVYLSIWPDSLVLCLGTSSGGLGFILVSMSTSVLVNGRKDFDFQRLYSSKFPRQHMAEEIDILGIRSFRPLDNSIQLYLTDPFSQVNQPIGELLKGSARGQVLSIISLVIFHDSSSYEFPDDLWIHIFWIKRLLYKINRTPIHYIDGGARGVIVIVVGIGHGDTSSNPGRGWLHFT